MVEEGVGEIKEDVGVNVSECEAVGLGIALE